MVVKLEIFSYEDRVKLTSVLAENGYPVWVETDGDQFILGTKSYYVCTEIEPKEN